MPWIRDSVGNLGFSDTVCFLKPMLKDTTLKMNCKIGTMTKLVVWGLHTNEEDIRQCNRNTKSSCDDLLNDKYAQDFFDKNCKGKSSCDLTSLESFLKQKDDTHTETCQ